MMENSDGIQWKRMRFKRNKVYVAIDDEQQPKVEKGKVLIRYQLDQSHQYWVHPSSVYPLDDPPPHENAPPQTNSGDNTQALPQEHAVSADKDNAICVYTDGASSGNPGPAGVGVVMIYRDKRKEVSLPIGTATNNVAELEAIRHGLAAIKNRQLPVMVFTDSQYALGVLTLGWKAELNQALIAEVKNLIKKFRQVQFFKVKGHAGQPENERADRLAVKAIQGADSCEATGGPHP